MVGRAIDTTVPSRIATADPIVSAARAPRPRRVLRSISSFWARPTRSLLTLLRPTALPSLS